MFPNITVTVCNTAAYFRRGRLVEIYVQQYLCTTMYYVCNQCNSESQLPSSPSVRGTHR